MSLNPFSEDKVIDLFLEYCLKQKTETEKLHFHTPPRLQPTLYTHLSWHRKQVRMHRV